MNLNPQNIEIRSSKNGLDVPVIDGILLHSIYDPIKEAEKFLGQNIDQIKSNRHILIFGCGYGYHIAALDDYMKELGGDYKILVVEPNIDLYNKYSASNAMVKNTQILYQAGKSAAELFQDEEVIEFLLKKPAVIPHAASFNLNEKYFSELLSYEAPTTLGDIINKISNSDLRDYFKQFPKDIKVSDITERLNSIPKDEYIVDEFLLLAFDEIQKTSRSV